jgi:hypothetical protein
MDKKKILDGNLFRDVGTPALTFCKKKRKKSMLVLYLLYLLTVVTLKLLIEIISLNSFYKAQASLY